MEILGREYGLLFCVGAEREIMELCPDGDLKNLQALLSASKADAVQKCVEMICVLSRWHEKAAALENGAEGAQDPLTPELIELLPFAQFQALQAEAARCILRDCGRSVEAAPGKKEKAPGSS